MSQKLLQKNLCAFVLGSFILVNAATPAMADAGESKENPIKIFLNGKVLSSAVAPIIENGTTMVPVRVISEEMGASVSWDAQSHKVSIGGADKKKLDLIIDHKLATISSTAGQKEKELAIAPMIKNGNTLVPLRFIAEELGLEVNWNGAERTVNLKDSAKKDVTSPSGIDDYLVISNDEKQAEIVLYTTGTVKAPQIKVLSKDELVFKGESKVKDSSLGNYRIELSLSDARLAAALKDKLGLETKKIEGDKLLQSIRLAYPPDDSAMVIYLGCKASPRTDLLINETGIFLNLINEDIQEGLTVSSKNIASQSEALQVQLSIPQLEGLKDKKIQDSINSKFTSQALQLKEETAEGLDEYVQEAKKEGWPIHPYAALSNYRVTYSKNDILSLYVDYYQYTGGAHGITDRQYSNIDLKTGQELQIKDFSKAGVNYQGITNQEIKKQMQLDPDKYFPEALTNWKGITDDQAFYVEDGKLICYFSQYEIAPYSSGIPEFAIPLTLFGDGMKANLLEKQA